MFRYFFNGGLRWINMKGHCESNQITSNPKKIHAKHMQVDNMAFLSEVQVEKQKVDWGKMCT